jgi:hypothetical protein
MLGAPLGWALFFLAGEGATRSGFDAAFLVCAVWRVRILFDGFFRARFVVVTIAARISSCSLVFEFL